MTWCSIQKLFKIKIVHLENGNFYNADMIKRAGDLLVCKQTDIHKCIIQANS